MSEGIYVQVRSPNFWKGTFQGFLTSGTTSSKIQGGNAE